MTIVIDTTDYKVEYDKALLTDALSATTLKTKTTLLAFSAILLVVAVYGLEVKQIPGLSIEVPPASPNLIKGVLALSIVYLGLQFVLSFFQDYLRWRLLRDIASVSHSGKVLRDFRAAIEEVDRKFKISNISVADVADSLIGELNRGKRDIGSVRRSRNILSVLQFGKFWALDFSAPVILSGVALWMAGGPAVALVAEVWKVIRQ